MRASVVIALFNGEDTIADQLKALLRQTVTDFEVIVADNGSSDCSTYIVGNYVSGRVRIIDASGERGQAHARNVGAAAATGQYLLFCDQDDLVECDWVARMVGALEKYDIVGGLSEGTTLNQGVSGWRTPPATAAEGSPLPFASGSNIALRRSVFERLGGWPTGFVGAGEDTALCWRAQLRGFTLGFEPDAIVHYRYRRRLWAHAKQQYIYGRQHAIVQRSFPELEHVGNAPWWRVFAWLVLNCWKLCCRSLVGEWVGALARWVGAEVGSRRAMV